METDTTERSLAAMPGSAWRALQHERPDAGRLVVVKQPGRSGERSFSAGHVSKDGRYDFITHSSMAPALMLTFSAEWCYVDEPNKTTDNQAPIDAKKES